MVAGLLAALASAGFFAALAWIVIPDDDNPQITWKDRAETLLQKLFRR
jgi:hypothetical protein